MKDIIACHPRGARGRWQISGEHAQRGRLARAVGPEDAEDDAARDVDAQVVALFEILVDDLDVGLEALVKEVEVSDKPGIFDQSRKILTNDRLWSEYLRKRSSAEQSQGDK